MWKSKMITIAVFVVVFVVVVVVIVQLKLRFASYISPFFARPRTRV